MPEPAMRALYGLTFDWTAVPTMAALICSGFHVGWRGVDEGGDAGDVRRGHRGAGQRVALVAEADRRSR